MSYKYSAIDKSNIMNGFIFLGRIFRHSGGDTRGGGSGPSDVDEAINYQKFLINPLDRLIIKRYVSYAKSRPKAGFTRRDILSLCRMSPWCYRSDEFCNPRQTNVAVICLNLFCYLSI